MKILGISFGREMKNTEILVKEALFAAKNEGADVKFISTIHMNINRCTQCGACTRGKLSGKELKCWVEDDFQALQQAMLDADGIILGAPVYSCGPTGQLKNVIDRNGAPFDKCGLVREKARRAQKGLPPLDKRLFRDRWVAYISVGGAATQNWVSMGLPVMHLFGFSGLMTLVGQIDAYSTGSSGVLLMPELLNQANEIGKAMAESVAHPLEAARYVGREGVCPVCHNTFLAVNGTTTVECPICGIYGNIKIDGNRLSVEWPDEQRARARSTMNGLIEHADEIGGNLAKFLKIQEDKKDYLAETGKKYLEFADTY